MAVVFSVVSLTLYLILLSQGPQASAKWEFELMLYSYLNPTSTAFFNKETVHCCDIDVLNPCGDDPCDNLFNFTLSPITCQPQNKSCCYGSYHSKVFNNIDTINFNSSSIDGVLKNPLTFSGDAWPPNDYVILMIYVDDHDSTLVNDFIDLLILPLPLSVQSTFTPVQQYAGLYNYSFISFSYRMKCANNYFGPTCSDPESNTDSSSTIILNMCSTNKKISQTTTTSCTVSATPPVLTTGHTLCSHSSSPLSSKTSSSSPPLTFLRLTLFISIGLGAAVLILMILLFASCITIIQLCKKTRRKVVPGPRSRRPLPPTPQGVSTLSSIQLQHCPAYGDADDDFSEELDNDMRALLNRSRSI